MRPSAREFSEFNGLLCSIVEKGLPLPPAINLMAGVLRDRSLRGALQGVARALTDGASLPDALARHPDAFPADYCALVRAGADSGRLAEVLRTAQIQYSLVARIRRKLARLGLYLGVAAVVGELTLALTVFVGRFMDDFTNQVLNPLQFQSKSLIQLGIGYLAESGWILLLGWPSLIVIGVVGFKLLQRSARLGGLGYRVPIWGAVQKSADLARFCCTLGIRLRSGAPAVSALESARDSVRTRQLKRTIDRVIHRVREGENLSTALFYQSFFPKTLVWGVSLGEANGELPRTLDHFADLYGKELDRRFALLHELLTPLGILGVGNVALLSAMMVISPFLQIIEVQQTLGGSSSRNTDILGLIIGIAVINLFFIGALQFFYLVVTTRRLKISLLVEHLATLARNGLPIHAGLRVVARDLGGYLGSRVTRVAQGLEEGKSLGEAFEAAPRIFPPLLRSMLTLGEKSGNVAGFLEEMRRTYRRISDLPFQSMYLFLYPLLLSIGINLVLAGLYAGIIPKFGTILKQLEVDPTMHETWWPRLFLANELILVSCIAMLVFLVLGGTSMHYGTSMFRSVKRVLDRGILWIPGLGQVLRDGAVQQFTLCAGLFLRSGAALPEALKAAAGVERNGVLRRRLERVAHAVSEGTRLTAAVRSDGAGEDLLWFLETGEASGLLSEHLLLAAVHYETKVRLLARLASRAIVPLFIVLNGVVVFGTFFLIFAPVRETIQTLLRRGPF